jgi:hypothetical protein
MLKFMIIFVGLIVEMTNDNGFNYLVRGVNSSLKRVIRNPYSLLLQCYSKKAYAKYLRAQSRRDQEMKKPRSDTFINLPTLHPLFSYAY